MSNTEALQYAERDHMALGSHYLRHVEAMTAEGLHRKSDIAAELAWRDAEIERLRAALAQPAASGEPVAWHMRVIGCDGSADWCELGAAPPEPVDGVAALPLVYATAQPEPARVPLTEAQMLAAVRSIGVIAPMGLTRDRGPYEVTEPTWFLTQLVRAIEAAHGITAKAKP